MLRFVTVLICAGAMGGTAGAETWIVDQTSDGFLNVRDGPGTQFPITRRIYPDDQARFLAEKGNWLRVSIAGGHIGWVSESFMTPITSYSGREVQVQPTSDGYLNLREGPGTGHAIKRRIYPGDYAVVLEQSGDWMRLLTRDGARGYSHSNWLK